MKSQERSNLFLRWHLSRIYQDERFMLARDRTVHVTIHRSNDALNRRLAEEGPSALRREREEELSWWEPEPTVEGWILESTLIQVVCDWNVAGDSELLRPPRDRAMAEEMVLIQGLQSPAPWQAALKDQASSEDHPELTRLAGTGGAVWLDFTLAARRAVKQRYRRALGEAETEVQGGDDAKQR